MPTSIEDHVVYTRNELNNWPYYQEMFQILSGKHIRSYLDIGANTGEFRNQVVAKIPTIEVSYLVEPETENFNFLVDNADCRTILFKAAIGYGGPSHCSLVRSSNVGGHQIEKIEGDIELKTLEDLNIPIVDFVKIDVEGMEDEIIENSTYLRSVKWIDIEFHRDPSTVQAFLEKNLPNFDIVLHQKGQGIEYGRCLLRNRL
jgi:FkbM family methyltransferase